MIGLKNRNVNEVFVRFIEANFKKEISEPKQAFIDVAKLKIDNQDIKIESDIDTLLQSTEYNNFSNDFKSKFSWKAGKYTVKFIFQSPTKFKYNAKKYCFELTQADVDYLRINIGSFEEEVKLNIADVASIEHNLKQPIWNWKHPEIKNVDE